MKHLPAFLLAMVATPGYASPPSTVVVRRGHHLAHAGLAAGGAGAVLMVMGAEYGLAPLTAVGDLSAHVGAPLLFGGSLQAHHGYASLGQDRGLAGAICGFTLLTASGATDVAAAVKREEFHYSNITVFGGPDPTLSKVADGLLFGSFGCGLTQLLGDEWAAERGAPGGGDPEPPLSVSLAPWAGGLGLNLTGSF